jgi:hypothetical protein
MMGGKTPETCWAVNKRQDNKLKNCCIWLLIYLNNSKYSFASAVSHIWSTILCKKDRRTATVTPNKRARLSCISNFTSLVFWRQDRKTHCQTDKFVLLELLPHSKKRRHSVFVCCSFISILYFSNCYICDAAVSKQQTAKHMILQHTMNMSTALCKNDLTAQRKRHRV